MNKGIKLIMYPYASDIEMKGLTKKHANEIFITDDMSIEDIDIFIKEILQDSYDNSLSYDEIFKNTIDNIRLHDMDIEAILYFYDNDIVITSNNCDDTIDCLYDDINQLLMDKFDIVQIGFDMNAYNKGTSIVIVDYDVFDLLDELSDKPCSINIDYDVAYEKAKQKYDAKRITYDKKELYAYLEDIIEIYYRFINVTIRNRLIELSSRYGDELTNLIYEKSEWKEV